MNPKPMQPYFIDLPTVDQAHADYNKVTSDHAPILATIPYQASKKKPKELKVVSWNVLENDSSTGFAMNKITKFGETKAQTKARHARIANTLATLVTKQTVDFITLQEIVHDPAHAGLLDQVLKKIGSHFSPVKINGVVVQHGGNITLYNKTQYECVNKKSDTNTTDRNVGGNVTKFQSLTDKKTQIRITNTHHAFSQFTLHHEESIKTHLTGKDTSTPAVNKNKNTISIFVGDFNGTVKPTYNHPHNLTTSVASANANTIELPHVDKAIQSGLQAQAGWAIDGCFYAQLKPQAKSCQIEQADIQRIRAETGEHCSEKELAPIDVTTLNEFQAQEVSQFKLAISVTDAARKRQIANLSETISSLDRYLNKKFPNLGVNVRNATNLNNENGIGITLSKELADYFFLLHNNNRNFDLSRKQDDIATNQYYVITASDKHAAELIHELKYIAANQDLLKLSQATINLTRKLKGSNKIIINEYENLIKSIRRDGKSLNASHKILIDHFTNVANKICKEQFNEAEARKSGIELQQKLQKHARLKMAIRILVGTLIGALIGFAVGLVVTAAIGGTGAIPLMFAGALTGAAIATASSTVGFSAACGLFSFVKKSKPELNIRNRGVVTYKDEVKFVMPRLKKG